MIGKGRQIRQLGDTLQMIGMLVRHDDRARVCERVLLGFVLSVVEAAREWASKKSRPGGASTMTIERGIRGPGKKEDDLMPIEADTAEKDCGGRLDFAASAA